MAEPILGRDGVSHDARPPGASAYSGPIALVATLTVVAAESLRMSGPLLDRIVADGGVITAAVTALVVFTLPALLGLLVGLVGARGAAVLGVLALVVLRLTVQATPSFPPGMAFAVVALATLLLVLRQAAYSPDGVASAVTGLVLGGAVDVAVRTLLGTWDAGWRTGWVGWSVAALEAVALVVALAAAARALHPDPAPVGRVGMLGGYLALSLLIFGSPGFVASSSGLGLGYASAVLLVGALFAVEALSRAAVPGGSGRWPDRRGLVGGFLLVAGVSAALFASGVTVAFAVLAAQVGAALVLARGLAAVTVPELAYQEQDPAERRAAERLDRLTALELDPRQDAEPVPEPDEPPFGEPLDEPTLSDEDDDAVELGDLTVRPTRRSAPGFAGAGLLAGLGFVLVVLLYQVHYEMPLPFPNQAVPIAAALLLAVSGLGRRSLRPTPAGDERTARRGRLASWAALPGVLLLVPVLFLVTAPAPAAPPDHAVDRFRLVSWNVRYLRDGDSVMDPEAVAVAIERQRPDVVLLQEVSRGWPIGGTTDGAEWLSRRLAMPYVYAPAADRQFGNLILSRLRITSAGARQLPQGDGTMGRSYAAATVELRSGRTVRLHDVHLAHRDQDTATRLRQVRALLADVDPDQATVVAGDFNAVPGSPEIRLVTGAGLVSAQDATGHGDLLTSPTDRPRNRIDWIFGTPDLAFTDFVRPEVRTSDHFPLAVTVQLG